MNSIAHSPRFKRPLATLLCLSLLFIGGCLNTERQSRYDKDGNSQEAIDGRDALVAQAIDVGDTVNYTKLDSHGNALAETAAHWHCVRDNATGLVWEVKTTDGGLHDAKHRYTWYNADALNNGGNAGAQNGGRCTGSDCDTQAFAAAVNAEQLCGFDDWRLPSRKELVQLVNRHRAHPAISSELFAHTQANHYWSASPLAGFSISAWVVDFPSGSEAYYYKYYSYYVRLVRGGE